MDPDDWFRQDQITLLQDYVLPQLLLQFTPKSNGVWVANRYVLGKWLRPYGWSVERLLEELSSVPESQSHNHNHSFGDLWRTLKRHIRPNPTDQSEIVAYVGYVSSLPMSAAVMREWRLFLENNKSSYDVVQDDSAVARVEGGE